MDGLFQLLTEFQTIASLKLKFSPLKMDAWKIKFSSIRRQNFQVLLLMVQKSGDHTPENLTVRPKRMMDGSKITFLLGFGNFSGANC